MRARARAAAAIGAGAAMLLPMLATTPAMAAEPTAADGVIAYGSSGSITVQAADGSDSHVVTSYDFPDEQLQQLALSADASTLAYWTGSSGDGGWVVDNIRVIDVETGAVVREIVDSSIDDSSYLADISPDGSSIVLTGQTDVVEVDVATGAETVLPGLGFSEDVHVTGYAPDGDALVVVDSRAGWGVASTYDLATAAIEPIAGTRPEAASWVSTVSYDGTVQYFSSAGDCGDAITNRIVSVDGTGDAPFSQSRIDTRAVFSPTGAHVLFERHGTPMTNACAGDSMESPVDVRLGDRDGTDSSVVFEAVSYDWAGGAPAPHRVAGASRYATAVALSEQAFPDGASTVLLASGESFPDALAAGPAAATLGAPVLLTPSSRMLASVLGEISRLDATRVVIVGGTTSVSATVERALTDAGLDVDRIAGSGRYHTSALLATEAFDGATAAYIASGADFPDALAAGAAAGAQGQPLLLVNGTGTVSASVADAIGSLGITDVRVVGGESVVTPSVVAQLEGLGVEVERVAGSSRYTTAVQVNQHFEDVDHVYLASGATFPDALAGAAVAGAQGEPLYLTQPGCVPGSTLGDLGRLGWPSVTILGGPSSVSVAVEAYTTC